MMSRAVIPFALSAVTVLLAACQAAPDVATQRAALVRADFAAATQPLILAEFTEMGSVGLLGKGGVNGGVESWRSANGVGLSLDRGVLVRVEGTGPGLLAADAAPTLAALAGGARDYRRSWRHLTPDAQVVKTDMSCTLSGPSAEVVDLAGRQAHLSGWTETCSGPSGQATNRYWTEAGNRIVKSDQWISDRAGQVVIDVPMGAPR